MQNLGNSGKSTWVLTVAACVGIAAYAVLFFPGAMGFDTAYQWWQARGGETTNIHGIGMTLLWRVANIFDAGPAPLFVLQLVLMWGGLAMVARSLRVHVLWEIAFIYAVAISPVCVALFSSVLSDVMFMAALAAVTGLLAMSPGDRFRIGVAFVVLFLACLLRKNALPAAVPLFVYAGVLFFGAKSVRTWSMAAAACIFLLFAGWVLDRSVDRQVSVFPATAIWDLAAVSLALNQMLLPEAVHGPGLDLDELRGAFVPYANTTLFERTHSGMRQPFMRSDDPAYAQIVDAWSGALRDHLPEYLAHRWRVSVALFGSKQADWPHELIYIDGEYHYGDNPPVAANTTGAHVWLVAAFDHWRATWVFAAWPYVLLALFSLILAWLHRRDPRARAAIAVASSGLLYALPLPFIAPSAELRYLGWTCLSALLALGLALSAWRGSNRENVPDTH